MVVESPFVQYCSIMDKKSLTEDQSLQWYYTKCYELYEKDEFYITNLLLEDFEFRAKYGLNVIASVEGEQGLGKSLFSLWMCFKLGEIFGVPFDI
jgi:hypothetical protein